MTKFTFTKGNLVLAKELIEKYPEGRQASAVMGLLDLAQRQNGGSINQEIIEYIADFLKMPSIRVHEVASFYSMYNLKPVGQYHVQLCGTTPCWLRGADDIKTACKEHLGIELNEVTKDKMFSLVEVECLGACANAPMVQINDDFYEDLTPESIKSVLEQLAKGQKPKIGSQIGRKASEPYEEKTVSKKEKTGTVKEKTTRKKKNAAPE